MPLFFKSDLRSASLLLVSHQNAGAFQGSLIGQAGHTQYGGYGYIVRTIGRTVLVDSQSAVSAIISDLDKVGNIVNAVGVVPIQDIININHITITCIQIAHHINIVECACRFEEERIATGAAPKLVEAVLTVKIIITSAAMDIIITGTT